MNMVTLKKKRLVLALSITAIVLVSTGLYYLATPAQGYTDKVKIIIPAEFRSRFPKLAGSVMIAMAGPEGFESYSIPLKDLIGKSREFNFGKIVSSWAKHVASNKWATLKNAGASLTLPTVTITFFLHDDNGTEYIATIFYGPIKHLMKQGYSEPEAARKALDDPLTHFKTRGPLTIKIDLDEVALSMVKFDLTPIVERLRVTQKTLLRVPEQFPTALTGATCPSDTEPYWTDLYNSKDDPPQEWMQHISGVDDQVKKNLWYEFATRLGVAYYFDAGLPLEQVLYEVQQYALEEGVWRMDPLLRKLYEKHYGYPPDPYHTPDWQDSQQPGTTMAIDIPYVGIKVYYYQNEPIQLSATLSKFQLKKSVKGFTFMGKLIYGTEETALTYYSKHIFISVLSDDRKEYIMVPVEYVYNGDGVAIAYDVDKITISGCGDYWRVVPFVSFVPIYMVSSEQIENSYIIQARLPDDPDPESLSDIAWSKTQTIVYYNDALTTGGKELVYEESNLRGDIEVTEKVAGIVFNLVKPWVVKAIAWAVGAGPVGELFLGIVADYFSYTHSEVGAVALAIYFDVWTETTVSQVYLSIEKWTLQNPVEYYDTLGYKPTMVIYQGVVGQPSYNRPWSR